MIDEARKNIELSEKDSLILLSFALKIKLFIMISLNETIFVMQFKNATSMCLSSHRVI
jgi:hypothetical protein